MSLKAILVLIGHLYTSILAMVAVASIALVGHYTFALVSALFLLVVIPMNASILGAAMGAEDEQKEARDK